MKTPRIAAARTFRVLIADDSPVQVHLLSGWLKDWGFTILVASDAMQAWMSALRNLPDAIILDITMPGGSGVDVLKRIRTSDKTKHIPVIVISGTGKLATAELVTRMGAVEFLEKPLTSEKTFRALSLATGQGGAGIQGLDHA